MKKKWTDTENRKLKAWLTRAKKPLPVELAAERLKRSVRGVLKHVERLKAKGLWDGIVV